MVKPKKKTKSNVRKHRRGITVKEAKLIQGIAQGKPKYKAAQEAYDTKSPESAAALASNTLKKVNVREALQTELRKQGIDIEQIIRPVTNALKDTDIRTQLQGHDRAIRFIMTKEESESPVTTVNFYNVSGGDKTEFAL